MSDADSNTPESMRLDKWLWHARFFKSRSLAAGLVKSGKCRVDGTPVSKPSRTVQPGQVLTFPKADRVRVIEIVALGTRRGPATEAQTLYRDISPEPVARPSNPRFDGKGKPSKKDRRNRASLLHKDAGFPLE